MKQPLRALLLDAFAALQQAGSLPPLPAPAFTLERTRNRAHGDFASNLAMTLAKSAGRKPRELAEALVAALPAHRLLARAEVAGPGFINLFLSPAAFHGEALRALNDASGYGRNASGGGRRVGVEFVSANPTGPLHVGHGRAAAIGDCLSRLLEASGWAVTREFYYNDAGAQIANLALSVQARALGIAPDDARWPADGYRGDYIRELARRYLAGETVTADGHAVTARGDADDLDAIRRFAVAALRHEQDLDLKAFGVHFDVYYLESSLYGDGKVEETVRALIARGHTYEDGGALWLKSSDFGDDKDRVMRKSDGSYTYFLPDVAYHLAKWERGFHHAINIQGSDHHGTVARVRAGLQAANPDIPATYPSYVLHKMVTVMRGGEEVKISKRAGSYVTVRDLIEWSGGVRDDMTPGERGAALQRGRDAVRFFLVSRKADTEFVFDVDLALAQSDENPVYYVQYAHARICSVLAQWAERDGGDGAALRRADLSPLTHPRELELMLLLAHYPEMLRQAAHDLTPHDVAFYARQLAGCFHAFYNAERVLVDDAALKLARLALLQAVRQVLHNALAVLGVSSPQRM